MFCILRSSYLIIYNIYKIYCWSISIGFLTNELFNKTSKSKVSISFNEYKRGKWSNGEFNADDLYYRVTPDVSDLLKKIVVKKLLTKEGDDYEKKSFHFVQGVTNNHTELTFTRKDYYTALRNYCILLRYCLLLNIDCLIFSFKQKRFSLWNRICENLFSECGHRNANCWPWEILWSN